MTEPRPDPTDPPEVDDTEAAFHAVLDREATAEQRRVVAREPDSAARLETLRDVRSRVGRVEAVAPGVLDGIRRAALDAPDPLDALDGIDGSDPAEPSGAPLAAVPDGRASAPPRRRRRLLPLPAVAALVAGLVALGAVLIITDGRGDDADTAETAAGSSADAAAEYDVSARFDSIDDLRAALETTADPDRLSEWSTGRAGADSPATATGDDQVYGEGQESADDPVASTTFPATSCVVPSPAGGTGAGFVTAVASADQGDSAPAVLIAQTR